MSRSSHHHRPMQQTQEQMMADHDASALATEIFDHFCAAITMRQILGLYRNMCDAINLRPGPLNDFYPKLKTKVRSWKAQALWKKFDARASHRAYSKGGACTGTRVLVIGAGPCGLRTAIEAQLLGAKVVVVEKRDRISRNNVLHLWPFLITDLRNLGAKKFYGKFCAGSIDHISIRQLQCILLKVALLLGVEVHEGVSFNTTVEPSDGLGWRADVSPEDHAVSHYEFDVLIGADGKRNTLESFRRKEFRGKLAIAITANFINKKTEAEAKVEEISGVAFIFNQSFFKELYQTTGIDLENIVYYKDETHYFVMTAKKHSLIDKGVIIQDFADPAELLASANVNTEKLLDYAKEAANFSTKYQMPNLEFAVNHYGKPDVAMFDFTSMFAAESSSRVIVRKNYRLLQCLVGDSLLEPFWPTGSGCARGFLSSMDAAYAIKLWSNQRNSILGVIAQRESIYRLLAQTTPENLQRDIGAYTVEPATRYPNLNKSTVNVWQVKHLLDADDVAIYDQTFMDTNILTLAPETPVRRKRRTGDTLPLSTVLLRWIKAQLQSHEFAQDLNELSECFTGGKVLCTLINRYRPDLVDLNTIKDYSVKERNDLAFKILETELGIPRVMPAKDSLNLENIETKIWLNYLEQICEVFRGEIPHVKHPKLDFFELKERTAKNNVPDFSHLFKANAKKSKSPMQDIDMTQTVHRRSILDEERIRRQRKYGPDFHPVQTDTTRRAKKRRSQEKTGNIEERQKRLADIEQNRNERQGKRRLQRYQQTQNFYKSLHMLQANNLLRESDSSSAFEDYSLYMYRQQAPGFDDRVKELERKLLYPDRDRGIQSAMPRGGAADEQFSDRIKSMEQKITSRNAAGTDKKPKDLLRAIGKIESTDWNVREIEKKIEQSKRTEIGKSKEKVPKWSKEQFLARQHKMAKPDRQESVEEKFKDIDQTLKNFDKHLKDGNMLEVGERGRNKVASIAGQFVKKDDNSDEKSVPVQKSSSKVGLIFNKQSASERCHFCNQTVYLMEKISPEGLILHRSCLKCHHCHTNLRLGGYAFDRDDPVGRFYCTQHFRLPAKAVRPVVRKSMKNQNKAPVESTGGAKPTAADAFKTPERLRSRPDNVAQLDLLDRGQTPERIEFENADAPSDGEPSLEHIIDENEWTDRNFITESEDTESNLSDSDSSDDDSESEYEEVNGSPLGVQTLQLATDWIGKQRHSYLDDDSDGDFYDSSEGMLDDDDADSQTEGEEFKKAREMRRQEVKVQPPPNYLQTDTETEVVSNEIVDQQSTNSVNNSTDKEHNNGFNRLSDEDKKSSAPINIADAKVEQMNDINEAEINTPATNDSFADKDLDTVATDKIKDSVNVDEPPKPPARRKKRLVEAELAAASVESISTSNGSLASLTNDIKRMDNTSSRPFSSDINALNEKLYNLNSFIKLKKDVDNLKRDSVVKDDIMKKLSLKERWLNQDTSGTILQSVNQALRLSKQDLVKDEDSARDSQAEMLHSSKPELGKDEEVSKGSAEEKLEHADGNATMDVASTSAKPESDTASKTTPDPEDLEIEKLVLDVMDAIQDDLNKTKVTEPDAKDMGKMLYNLENNEGKMTKTLKNIEVKNFSDTMDTIKSQMATPKVSKQSSCDLTKYFPNQKPQRSASAVSNKNQKSLKEVNLSKYFSQTPEAIRKEPMKSQPATMVTPSSPNSEKRPVPLALFGLTSNGQNATASRKNSLTNNSTKSSLESIDQLDGATDFKLAKPVKKTTSLQVPTGAVKRRPKPKMTAGKSYKIVNPQDLESEPDNDIFEEILHANCSRPSSAEYRRLFEGEKSPSDDLSDKLEHLLEEEERARQRGDPINSRKKKLVKAKSLGDTSKRSKLEGSSQESLQKPDSPPDCTKLLTDLEKTMAFLKEGWKTEASRFLESKRDSFFSRRKNGHVEEETEPLTPAKASKPAKKSSTSVASKQKAAPKVPQQRKAALTNKTISSPSAKKPAIKAPVKSEKVPATITSKQDKLPKALPNDTHRERFLSDVSDLSLSDREIDKILDELTQDMEELREIEAKLERKESLPDVVTSGGKMPRDANSSEGAASLVSTREELDLLEKGELARKMSSGEIEKVENVDVAQDIEKFKNTVETPVVEDASSKGIENYGLKDNSVDTNQTTEISAVKVGQLSDSTESLQITANTGAVIQPTEPMANDELDNTSKERKSSSGSLSLNFSYSATSDSSLGNNFIPMEKIESKNPPPSLNPIATQEQQSRNNSREKTVTSEEDSIEALFNQLADDMLVGVEFDSSDEFVRIIPQGKLDSEEFGLKESSANNEKDTMDLNVTAQRPIEVPIKYFEIRQRDASASPTKHFPIKPVRRNKSTSSSGTPDIPAVPARVRKVTLPKLDPIDMAPSVQDILQKVKADNEKPPVAARRKSGIFPMKHVDDEAVELEKPASEKKDKDRNVNTTKESPAISTEIVDDKLPFAQSDSTHFATQSDEEAYIEQLERERRAALRKRDEMYARENSSLTLPIAVPTVDEPTTSDSQLLSASPVKSSYSSIPASIGSSHDSINFASATDVSTMPPRPYRRRSKDTDESVDRSTDYLVERSKMLHSMKEDFVTEKMACRNPYLKHVIDEEKHSQDNFDPRGTHDSSIDGVELRNPPQNPSYRKFPTSRSLQSDRGREQRHGSSESMDRSRKTYSLANTLGPRNFVEYFKRSPSKSKESSRDRSKDRRDGSKESCVVS